jgi:hypothetical protein
MAGPRADPCTAGTDSISAGDSRHFAAATLARTCSGVLALAMTEATTGWLSSQPKARSSSE